MERHPGIWWVIAALLVSLLLAALDGTVVATALPTIAGQLGGLEHISWVFTAYLLTSTITVPLFGKISDIYGRKPVYQFTILVFLLGSVLAGLSQNMTELILFRGVQGIGGGGIMAMTFTILAEILSPRERGKYIGYFTGVFAAASVVGPLIGGFFVDHATWRWVFYINVPLGVVALAVTGRFLQVPDGGTRRPIDVLGAGVFSVAVTAMLLGATWGGQQYPWGSPTIVGLFAAGLVFSVLFVVQERRAPEPLLPLRFFRDPVFSVSIAMAVLLGSVMVAGSVFLPLFLQVVRQVSATSSGFLLVPMMGGILLGSAAGGRLITRWGRYKPFPIVGGILCVAGVGVLATIDRDTTRLTVTIGMAVFGLGVGIASPVTTLAVQNTAAAADMGAATSAVNFFRSLGSAFGVAILGAAQTARLDHVLARELPAGVEVGGSVLNSPTAIRQLSLPVQRAVSDGIASGVGTVFRFSLPIVTLGWLVSFFLPEVPLREDVRVNGGTVEGMEGVLAERADTATVSPGVAAAPLAATDAS